MRKAPFLLAASFLSAFSLAPARAETSVACTYMLMRVYHAELDYCRVALPKDEEARYSRMRGSMEKFIRDNAKNDPAKILSGIETDNIPRALKGLSSCRSDDFKLARQAMDQMLSPGGESIVTNTVKVPRDPMVGECGS